MIEVLGLIQKRENQSDTSIACIMLNDIYSIYSDTNNK